MSVSAKLNLPLALGCLAAVALVAGLVVFLGDGTGSSTDDRLDPVTTRVPAQAVDVVDSATPARSAVELSRRLFTSSATVVLVDRHDLSAQRSGIAAAQELGVPVLLDDAAVPREVRRLGASTVLTVGTTRTLPGARRLTGAARQEVPAERGARRTSDVIVVTRSVKANAVAVATARVAGATVLEVPSADPRTSPAAEKVLRARKDTPVIAVGRPFARGFAYTLAVVRAGAEQPSGGYLALGRKHYTAMYGHPGAPSLGVLGEQGVKASVARVERLARKYRAVSSSTFVPTFEIIATVASAGPGRDKNYSNEVSVKTLTPLVDAAGKAGIYVILDLQPGRTDFLVQAKRYRPLLERPNVGLALDPEWRLKKKQKHLRQIGSVDVAEVNRVADWLAGLTRRSTLPQKLFVLHQFSPAMIQHRSRLDTTHPELATVLHVDGSGPQGAKQGTWDLLRQDAPPGVGWGWKNFLDEDKPMLDARQTWRQVRPHPDLVTYQ